MTQSLTKSVFLFLLVTPGLSPAVEFKRHTITVSSEPGYRLISHLQDVDNDGLTDLLVFLPRQNELQLYRQRRSGYAGTPDQTLTFPPQSAWIAVRDIDGQPGDELLISTATGILCFRQDRGAFEASPRTLIEAQQVFVTKAPRIMTTLPNPEDANAVIPVTFADHAVLYQKDSDGTWRPGRTFDLSPCEARWRTYQGDWTLGPGSSANINIRTEFRANAPDHQIEEKQSEETEIQALVDKTVKDAEWGRYGRQQQDVNGDGREDLVLWRAGGDVNPRTTTLIFLRGPDDRLPERPTQVVRSSGIPIRVDRDQRVSPFWDLDGDSRCELILVALKTRVTSWSGLVDIALSGGVDWVFTVRSGKDGTYSGGPDFRMDLTTMTPRSGAIAYLFLIDGDFNGDGREDLLVERTPEQFDVYLSSTDAGFFQNRPPVVFEAPVEARQVDTSDLNGDGISDFYVQALQEARLTVYLSQSDSRKGTQQ